MSYPIPAPVGGWNARDVYDRMGPNDAIVLRNMVTQPGYVERRPGYAPHATGLGDKVKTLAPYNWEGTSKLLAVADGEFWDITSAGAATNITGLVSPTIDRYQYVQFKQNLILTNGIDTPQVFDGTTLSDINITSGPTATDLFGCNIFKRRAYYWENSSSSFWYATAGAFQGALSEFDLSESTNLGGSIAFMLTWTRDGGDGMDDLAVFMFDTGEALIYQGDDPGNVNSWNLVGRFQIGEPVDVRGHCKIGGDEMVITRNGYVNLSAALASIPASVDAHLGGKIVNAVTESVREFGDNEGWEATYHPTSGLIYVNVPISTTESRQHVLNTRGGGWSEWLDIDAYTWVEFDGQTYFGGEEVVYRMARNATDNGVPVTFYCQPAFNYLNAPGVRKKFDALQILSDHVDRDNLQAVSQFDLSQKQAPTPPVTFDAFTSWGDPWGSPWSASNRTPYFARRPMGGDGFSLSALVSGSASTQSVRIFSFRYEVTPGGDV